MIKYTTGIFCMYIQEQNMPRLQEELNACELPDLELLVQEISESLDTSKAEEWLQSYDKEFIEITKETKKHNARFIEETKSPTGLDLEVHTYKKRVLDSQKVQNSKYFYSFLQ
jgi:hypothetical protein